MLRSVLLLLAAMIVTGSLLITLTAYLMAMTLLRPPRMTDGRAAWRLKRLSPGDLHLPFSTISFSVREQGTDPPLHIAGWWIPHPRSDRTVVMIHGYADAKVGVIAWAPTFFALGFNLLAIDLRAHGQSGGKYTTAGVLERYDVSQVIDAIRRDHPGDTEQVILFGVSLGAAVAAAAAVLRDDITAVILDCPFPDYKLAARAHTAIIGAPGGWLQRWSFRWAGHIAKVDFSTVRPVDLIPKIGCPLMIVRSETDVFIDEAAAALVKQAADLRPPDQTLYWNAADAHHVEALAANPELYRQKLTEFLSSLPTSHVRKP